MMRSLLLAVAVCLAVIHGVEGADATPTFPDFPAYQAPPTAQIAPILDTRDKINFRTRIREAARQEPNYGGHYVIARWGCGTSCASGAIIDLSDGSVFMLPSVCCSQRISEADFEPIDAKRYSLLLIFRGRLNDVGPNEDHYFVFRNRVLEPVSATFKSTKPAPQTTPPPTASADLPSYDVDSRCGRIPNREAVRQCVEAEQMNYDLIRNDWYLYDENQRQRCVGLASKAPMQNYEILNECMVLAKHMLRQQQALPHFQK